MPSNLSKFKNLFKLTLNANPIQSYQKAAVALASLPSLEILNIDLSINEHALLILKSLPKLRVLNNVSTNYKDEPDIDKELKQNLEEGNVINRNNSNNNDNNNKDNNDNDNDNKISSSREMYNDLIINNKREIIDIDEENLDKFSINSEIRIYHQINEMIKRANIADMIKFNKSFKLKLNEQIQMINQCMDIPNYEYAMIITKAKIDIYDFLLDFVMEQIFSMNEQMNTFLFQELGRISNIIRSHIKKNENCLFEIIIQLKEKINSFKNNENNEDNDSGNPPHYKPNNFENSKEVSEMKSNKTYNRKLSNKPKKITKNHLRSIINEVIQAKELFNKRNNTEYTKLNKTTMKQFLTSFLLKKYGLKTLTLELQNSIMNAINLYSNSDSEICLFGKILNNDIEEESITVFNELKKTINELLAYYYMKKLPYKSNYAIESLAKSKQRSFLSLDEWKTILTSIFSDSEVVLSKMIDYVINKNKTNQTYMEMNLLKIDDNHRYTKEEIKEINYESMNILYEDFIKVLLDFQIKLREKYLKPFVKIYKQIDDDNDGIIDEVQFSLMMKSFDIFDHDEANQRIDELLEIIDPFNSNRIIFSDCVSFLGKEKFARGINCSILDKINMLGNSKIIFQNKCLF